MAPPVPTECVGYYCKVDLARRSSLLTSWQVNYANDTFDLKNAHDTFRFVFRLYNFVEIAVEDDGTLREPWHKVSVLDTQVKNMGLAALTTPGAKRKAEGDGNAAGGKRSKNARTGNEDAEHDILSDVAIMEEVKSAGYTIPPEDEDFKPLLPVSVSFP
jgi:hypothetical protein